MQLNWFGDYQGHKMKLKFEFLGFAVMSRDCKTQFDMTAKIILALYDLKQEKFPSDTPIRIEFWVSYQLLSKS